MSLHAHSRYQKVEQRTHTSGQVAALSKRARVDRLGLAGIERFDKPRFFNFYVDLLTRPVPVTLPN
ncbi:hypothetical protein GNZ12_19130 [Paraburkholderia sp. 1N]|uniref:Uncharacterized protein n=1 Tax=Paraburkholderia solitsugae TaxID=2675748 RepID=A0ABX2BTK5_9BURK|nr:hypothetical protein [Paraburkholderia solitsugae]NPT43383.1 hypothetical protein [Paraburkholderia solitsugae]